MFFVKVFRKNAKKVMKLIDKLFDCKNKTKGPSSKLKSNCNCKNKKNLNVDIKNKNCNYNGKLAPKRLQKNNKK